MKKIFLTLLSIVFVFGQLQAQSSENDFDFLITGDWEIKNRRLKDWLADSDEWVEFTSIKKEASAKKILGGLGNLDEVVREKNDQRVYGVGIRLFNPNTKEWNIFWTDSAHLDLGITKQVTGSFDGNIGEFFGEELYQGKMVKLRFIWTKLSADRAYWEQAYFDEKNSRWEVNWTMTFTRPN